MLEEFKKFAVRGNIVDFAFGGAFGGLPFREPRRPHPRSAQCPRSELLHPPQTGCRWGLVSAQGDAARGGHGRDARPGSDLSRSHARLSRFVRSIRELLLPSATASSATTLRRRGPTTTC